MPASDNDPVPAFVRDEAISMKKLYPHLHIDILAPHNGYGNTRDYRKQRYYNEYRFHYFWPFRWEKLTGKGIQPALKKNKLLYFQLPGLFLAEFFATWKLVRDNKPDLIYAHWFTPQALTGALVSKITKVPLVFDTQASDAIVLKIVPFSKKIVAAVCGQALAYTVPSNQTLDKLLHFSTEKNRQAILDKVTMVPYGTNEITISAKEAKKVEEKYNLKDKRVIYFIGRLVDRKGVDILINAFGNLKNTDDKLRLIIVGDGQDRRQLEDLARKHGVEGSILFTGFLTGKDRFALLKLAEICVIPSLTIKDQSEGLPVVFMEGLMQGKTMVITDATGAHEIVRDKQDAIVVASGSCPELVKGLNYALNMKEIERRRMHRAALKLGETFKWQNIAKKRYNALISVRKD